MTPVRYVPTVLTLLGIIVFFAGSFRGRDLLQVNRWRTLAALLIGLGALAVLIRDPSTDVTVTITGIYLLGWGAATAYFATKAALSCIIGRHPIAVINKISAVTDEGEIVTMDVQWSPDAIGDRELLLGSLLRHGAVVETRCASCGVPRPRHTGA